MKTKEGRGYEVDQSRGREATNHRRQFPRAVMAGGGGGRTQVGEGNEEQDEERNEWKGMRMKQKN